MKYPGGDLPASREISLIDLEADTDDEDEFCSQLFDRRSMEGDLAHLTVGFGDKTLDAQTAKAQDLMYEAWSEPNPAKRLALAHRALKKSKDCADAYVLLAEEEADSLPGAMELYRQGV